MKRTIFITLTVLLFTGRTNAQEKKETYKFSHDINENIQRDTLPWKYQLGATEYSLSEHFKKALETWDKNGSGIPKLLREDSLYFMSFTPKNARHYIINRSKNEQIIIINEAHHNPMHRVFTTSLLQDLYNNGYRYFGLEALSDTLINKRKYAITESGFYTKEPQLANLIYEALRIGFILFNYEASQGKNGKEREIEQAKNIASVIEKDPNSKFLIHCGYDHVIEGTPPNKGWEKAMAGRIKEFTQINPFTIDQVKYSEKGDAKFNHPYIRIVNLDYPVIMVNERGQTFNGQKESDQIDCVIIHPTTKFNNDRPNWLSLSGQRRSYFIPKSRMANFPVLVFAYRKNEFDKSGIPVDIVEITNQNQIPNLFLTKGEYKIILKDKDYKIINEYEQKID